MSLLERYIFRRALVFTVGSLGSLVLIVWVVQALQRIDIVRTSASAAGNIFWIALMLIPDLAAGVLPFAVLIGAVQALNGLNADSERAVIAASGASISVVARPIVALGLIAALMTLVNSHAIGPAAQASFYNGLRTINADAITLFLQPGRFEQVQEGLVMSIGSVRGSTVSSLFLSDRRDAATDLTYFAKEAQIVDQGKQSYLLLFDGQLHRKSNQDGAISVIQFQTYAFDLANLRPANDGDWVRTSERSTQALFDPDINDASYQQKPESFTRELTQRFSDWLYPLAFALWAIAVAGEPRTNRRGTGPAMSIGLAGALALKALGFVLLSSVERNTQLAVVVYLLPIASIALSLVLISTGVSVSALPIFERMAEATAALAARLRRSPQASVARGRAH